MGNCLTVKLINPISVRDKGKSCHEHLLIIESNLLATSIAGALGKLQFSFIYFIDRFRGALINEYQDNYSESGSDESNFEAFEGESHTAEDDDEAENVALLSSGENGEKGASSVSIVRETDNRRFFR